MELVLITSVINTSQYTKPFSYTPTRSTFSTEERFEQTQESITSVRKYIPNSFIVLIECSDISEEYEEYLKTHCDIYYNLNKHQEIVDAVGGIYKGYGEAAMHIGFLKYVFPNIFASKREIKRFWKLSGRYYFSEFTDLSKFDENKICFKIEREGVYNTRLFNFPIQYMNIYVDLIKKTYYETEFNDYTPSIEELFFKYLEPENIKIIDITGVRGFEAVSFYKRCID